MSNEEIAQKIEQTKTKINRVKRAIGSVMVKNGMNMVINSNDYVKFDITGDKLDEFFMEMGFNISKVKYDRWYNLTTWDNWKEVIGNDIIHQFPYMSEVRDCDDFAWLFAIIGSFVYNMLAAPCYGTIMEANKSKTSYHYFNMIPTMEKDGLALWAYEPITGRYSRIKRGEPIIIGVNVYKAYKLHFI